MRNYFRRFDKPFYLKVIFCSIIIGSFCISPLFTSSAITFLSLVAIIVIKMNPRGLNITWHIDTDSSFNRHGSNAASGLPMCGNLIDVEGNAFGTDSK